MTYPKREFLPAILDCETRCAGQPSNIAEGFESRTQPQFVEYLGRAKASAGELRSQTYVALDAAYITDNQFQELTELCKKCSGQISRFMSYLQKNSDSRRVRENNAEYHV